MRNNEPVTQREFVLEVDATLMSTTDLQGNITYANDLFCTLTGFAREELIGQPHSIVRHPDVPKAVYKDMWDTIKAGKTWTGIVPNLGKGGVLYVVDTTVQPLFDAFTAKTGAALYGMTEAEFAAWVASKGGSMTPRTPEQAPGGTAAQVAAGATMLDVNAGVTSVNPNETEPALLVADGNRQPVQHLSGGRVQAVLVREGDAVVKDQVLLRIDDARSGPVFREAREKWIALSAQAARKRSSAPCSTLATSRSRTGALSRQAIIRFWYSATSRI